MREFFRGWRRKVGCVTLIFALVACGEWMRSYFTYDAILLPTSIRQYEFLSVNGSIDWVAHDIPLASSPSPQWVSYTLLTWDYVTEMNRRSIIAAGKHEIWIIPHWSIVLPLTLLSAYLLLWKPRPKPKGEPNA